MPTRIATSRSRPHNRRRAINRWLSLSFPRGECMNVQMALLSILGIVAAVFSFERDVVADTQSTEKIQNNSVTPLMPSEVLLSLEPIARENVLSIVQLATRYTNLSERAFDELHGTTTTNNKDVTTTRIVNSDGTETEIAYSRQDKFLTGLRQTRLDKSSIIAAFVRPSLPVDGKLPRDSSRTVRKTNVSRWKVAFHNNRGTRRHRDYFHV